MSQSVAAAADKMARKQMSMAYSGVEKPLSELASELFLWREWLVVPILLYDAEAWTMTTFDDQALGVFEGKFLGKICGPLR